MGHEDELLSSQFECFATPDKNYVHIYLLFFFTRELNSNLFFVVVKSRRVSMLRRCQVSRVTKQTAVGVLP